MSTRERTMMMNFGVTMLDGVMTMIRRIPPQLRLELANRSILRYKRQYLSEKTHLLLLPQRRENVRFPVVVVMIILQIRVRKMLRRVEEAREKRRNPRLGYLLNSESQPNPSLRRK